MAYLASTSSFLVCSVMSEVGLDVPTTRYGGVDCTLVR